MHASVRHLDCLYEKLTLTDKVVHAYSLGSERVEDVIEMARIASGLSQSEFESAPRLYTNINSSSPLKHDWPMLDGAMRFARRGQPVIVTPFTLAGAMAPVTMAGAVVQSVAEALAAIALLQVIRPGLPCMMGTFTSNVDMKSGAPAFGTPEYIRATQMTGQMARFYGLPLRASNACASNAPDGQAMWESMNSLWSAVQSGVNLVYHAAGWLEGGLIASYEKFVMDCEVLQQFQRYFEPALTDTSPDALGARRHRRRRPPGHFFGAEHTQSRYASAFNAPFLSDWRNYEAWAEAGAPTGPRSAPTASGRRSSPNTSRRRWTRRSATSSPPSSPAASARAARPPTIEQKAPAPQSRNSNLKPAVSGIRTMRSATSSCRCPSVACMISKGAGFSADRPASSGQVSPPSQRSGLKAKGRASGARSRIRPPARTSSPPPCGPHSASRPRPSHRPQSRAASPSHPRQQTDQRARTRL